MWTRETGGGGFQHTELGDLVQLLPRLLIIRRFSLYALARNIDADKDGFIDLVVKLNDG